MIPAATAEPRMPAIDLLFVSGNPYLPQIVGGVEVNTHELVTELRQRGHRAAVAAKLSLRDGFGAVHAAQAAVSGRGFTVDHALGYPVFRARRLREVVAALPRPGLAVIQNGDMPGFGEAFAACDVPTIAYFHALSFEDWDNPGEQPRQPLPFQAYLAVSGFTAGRFGALYGIEAEVVPPFFRRENYVTQITGGAVTFINPITVKGLDRALRIAELCPEIPFRFVRAWPLSLGESLGLRRALRRLPNVTLCPRTGDMRSIYRETSLLLAPSHSETWCRVVSEAQFNGIPVVASDRGGLPQSVGPGGVILSLDEPAERWASTVRAIWSDAALHARLSEAALRHAARAELDPARQIAALLDVVERVRRRRLAAQRRGPALNREPAVAGASDGEV